VNVAASSALPAGAQPIVNQTLPLTGTPSGAQAGEPAWVRKGSASTQKAYETALAFEQMLVEELSRSLTASSGLGGEEGESAEGSAGGAGASGPLSSMLPQALTSGVMSAGGLGLAAQMTRSLAGQGAPEATGEAGGATGGASASTGTGTPIPRNKTPSVAVGTGGTSA
jgi:Rod binding domain-containing protein